MSNVVNLKTDKSEESINTYLSSITELIKDKKVNSILSIVYLHDDEDPVFYVAGKYINIREILGDIRLVEDVVLNEF